MKKTIANILMFVLCVIVFTQVFIGFTSANIKETDKLSLATAYTAGMCVAINGIFLTANKNDIIPLATNQYLIEYAAHLQIEVSEMRDACIKAEAEFVESYNSALK